MRPLPRSSCVAMMMLHIEENQSIKAEDIVLVLPTSHKQFKAVILLADGSMVYTQIVSKTIKKRLLADFARKGKE